MSTTNIFVLDDKNSNKFSKFQKPTCSLALKCKNWIKTKRKTRNKLDVRQFASHTTNRKLAKTKLNVIIVSSQYSGDNNRQLAKA